MQKQCRVLESIPDDGIAEQQADDNTKIGEIQEGNGDDGCHLHGPRQWVPHVPQEAEQGIDSGFWQLVGPILL